MAPKKSGKRRASQDFYTRARASLCCWSPVNKGKARLVALPGYSTHGSSPGRLPGLHADSEAARANPLVALPYLLLWNTVLLDRCSFGSAVTLCTTIILVPQALAIRGFEPEQIGPAIIWSAVPLIPLALAAALLLLRKFDPRLLLAIALPALPCCLLNSQYSSTWAAENFYRTELLTGVGQRLLSSTCRLHRAASHLRRGFGQT